MLDGGGGGGVLVVVFDGGAVLVCGGGTLHDPVPAGPVPAVLAAVTETSTRPVEQKEPLHGKVSWVLVPDVWALRLPPVKPPVATTV
ncbi:hypothetical protein GCM10029964_084270 [Kibdelosporangium lantanae]